MSARDTQEAGRTWPVAENFMPDFRLPSTEGQPVETAGYRGRSLVLVFTSKYDSAATIRLPADLARHRAEIAREGAEVLVIVQGTPAGAAQIKERDSLPFPVLADEDGQVHRTYGAMTRDGRAASEAVYVAGPFGKVYLASRAADGPPLPTAAGVLGMLRFIKAECPECGQDEPL